MKYKTGNIDYRNSDATWHVLLTIECYNETPILDHLFLPIVSLGENDDKYIPWGSTIPDNKGNYYYTSFSPAGYFFPWLFIKLFRLPICEKSLYIFNTTLFILSAILWGWLILLVYRKTSYRSILCFIGMITYIFSPELLHGMGITYWHQSIMQVTLLLQIIAYFNNSNNKSKKWLIIFYIMTIINPYIEWTGYIANIGFAIAELIINRKNIIKALQSIALIGGLTIGGFVLFIFHYLLRVDLQEFLQALKNRFMARNVTTNSALVDVFGGYLSSFLYLWLILLILIIWNFIKNKQIQMHHGLLVFIMLFPVLENVVMKQHALQYTYDRMKLVYFVSFTICILCYNLLESSHNLKLLSSVLIIITAFTCGMNLKSYLNDKSYCWNAEYKKSNELVAAYVNPNYPNSVIGSSRNVRGYLNLLFKRGIYEWSSSDNIKEITKNKGKQYAIWINAIDEVRFEEVSIYDIQNKTEIKVSYDNGQLCYHGKVTEYQTANLTDENWSSGYSEINYTLLFERQEQLLLELLSKDYIVNNGDKYKIINVDYDDIWIRVQIDQSGLKCKYPAKLIIE